MADYGVGIGGKFQKRPFRRATATPYDRPPSALRGIRGRHVADPVAEGSSTWLSKLVDPASRLIATGASRFFSSVFRKRLTAPSIQRPEGNHESKQGVPELNRAVLSSELQKEEDKRDNMRNNFNNDGITELEQLLKQKTFTRAEFDRLAELLRSRTVEPSKVETEVNNEQQCNEYQQRCINFEKKGKMNLSAQYNRIESSKEHESLLVPQDSLNDQTASPAELAKAYMGSKTPSSAVSLRNQAFREDIKLRSIPSSSKSLDLSVAPRSTIRFSGIPEHTVSGYPTPRPLGRSAMCRMSRSPYFKVNSAANMKGGELIGNGYTCTSLSQWTPRSVIQSGGKQVLKRGSSVLDGEFGSVGPIRRIRQKCHLNSPSKDSRASLSASLLSSPSTPLSKEVPEGSTSVQKPLLLHKPKYGTIVSQAAGEGISNASVASLPARSSETAHKLLQQLDKLLPLPKERAPEMQIIDRDESPSKLTLDMLHGRALRSMEEIDSSKFSSIQGSGKLVTASNSHLPTLGSSSSGKMDIVEENGHSNSASLGVKLMSENNGRKNASTPSTDANPGRKSTYSVVSDYASPQTKRPAFHMSAPEDSFDLDDDEFNMRVLASSVTKGKEVAESKMPEFQNVSSVTAISEAASKMPKKNNIVSETATSESEMKVLNYKKVISETVSSETPPVSSSESMAISSSISHGDNVKKGFIQSVVSEKGTGFTMFTSPIASDPCPHSQQPPASTVPAPLHNQPILQREQTTSSVFSSGSSAANIFAVSSTVGFNDSAGVKVDAETRLDMKSSASHATIIPAEGSNPIKVGETQKAGDLFKSFGNAVSSGSLSTAPVLFSFGASMSSPSLNSGSLGLSSSMSSVSATSAITLSESPVSSIFPHGTAKLQNSMSSLSSSAPIFSTVPSFQFGSGTSNASATISLDKSKASISEAEPTKPSPFGTSNSPALGTSVFPSTSCSSSATTFAISSSVGATPALMTLGTSSSTANSTTLATSLFSNMGGSSSSLAVSSSFSSTGNNIFGFSASTQSTSSSPSFANSNSQNSTATFGAIGGSIFSAQSTHPANGTSVIPQSSTGHLTSLSSPAFELSNSSSSIFGSTAVGSATLSTKPFTPSSGFSTSTGSSTNSSTSPSFMLAATFPLFGSSSQASSSSVFGSTSLSSTSPSTGFVFGSSAPASGSSISISNTSSPSTGFTFGLSAPASASSTSITNTSSPPTGFSFGLPAPGSGSSPFTHGSLPGTVFSFTSANPTSTSIPSSSLQPAFRLPNQAIGFGSMTSGSAGNDQMNVEDSMTDDTNQAPSFPTFGQQANQPTAPSFTFNSSALQPSNPSVFQFNSHQNPSAAQNPSPFQTTGNSEFPQGGSFSLGSGGGDKSGRRFVRVSRNKQRKK